METEQKSAGQELLETAGDAAGTAAVEGCLGCLFNGFSGLAVIVAFGLWVIL